MILAGFELGRLPVVHDRANQHRGVAAGQHLL
jgi:hypothetical protein